MYIVKSHTFKKLKTTDYILPSGQRSTSQCWINVDSMLSLTQTILNVDIWLRIYWFCCNDQPKINFSTETKPSLKFKFQVEKLLKFGWQIFNFWLKCAWEVDFWLIIVTKSMISQPQYQPWSQRWNVEIWLKNWFVSIE